MIQAVCGISFNVQKSKTLALVGESGSGKTTVARLILRLEQPDEGEIYFDGNNVLTCDAHIGRRLRREIQMIFQDPYSSLNPHKTVYQIISEPLKIHALCSKNDIQEHIENLLMSVGLSADIVQNYPHEFSGGQRQRIGIARALAVNPRLIICDEPVSALDVSIRAQILNLLVDLQKNRNLTYIFIGHDLSVVRYISDQVAVMYMGKIVEQADTNDFYEKSLHPYSEALLSATPITSPEQRKENITFTETTLSTIKPLTGCPYKTRCKLAEKLCTEKEPQLRNISETHSVACHLKG
jgi:oligopeptide transport system ATP-binding protein